MDKQLTAILTWPRIHAILVLAADGTLGRGSTDLGGRPCSPGGEGVDRWRSHRPFLVASKSMRAQWARELTGHILLSTYTLKVMVLFWAELDALLHRKWVTKWPFTMAQRWLCVAVGPCPLEIVGPSWCPAGTQPFWKVGQRSENSHPIPFAKAATTFFWPEWEAHGGHWTMGALRCSSCVSQARALIKSLQTWPWQEAVALLVLATFLVQSRVLGRFALVTTSFSPSYIHNFLHNTCYRYQNGKSPSWTN